jgi:hypothetical protein
MSYTAGQTILDDEYNIFVSGSATSGSDTHTTANAGSVWGTGSTTAGHDYGYGESDFTEVSAGATVTATQWNTLLDRIEVLASHQGSTSTVTAYSTLAVASTITALSTVQTDINTIYNNRRNCLAMGAAVTSGGVATYSSTWLTSITQEITVSFASSNAARYYFNAGGNIKLSFSHPNTSNSKDTSWNQLASEAGTVVFTGGGGNAVNDADGQTYSGTDSIGETAGTTPTVNDNFGYVDTTTSYTQIFNLVDDGGVSSAYNSNRIRVQVKGNSAHPASVLTFQIFWDDQATDTTSNPNGLPDGTTLDNITGNNITTLVANKPSSTFLTSASWGTPTLSVVTNSGS